MAIPGTRVVAKQGQKAVQKLFNIGGKEVMENISKQTPELFNTLSDMNKSGIVKAVDSNLHSSDSVIKAATNKDFSTITDIANDGNSKALVDQTNQQYSNWIHPKAPHKNNFTVSKENLAPGIEAVNLENQIENAKNFHGKFEKITGDPGEGGLSTGSTIGPLPGQQKGFNQSAKEKALTTPRAYVEGKGLGTKIEEVPGKRGTRTEITAEIERMPYKELHHIFGKSMGEKIVSNVWRLIDEGKATIEDLINLNYWAKSYGTGMGDFGTEAVNRVSHSSTHTFARKFGLEMSADDIKAMPEFDDINELTSYFRELLDTRVKPMMGELDLQQGSYDVLPDKMRLDVEMLKVAKEDASRELTQSYKDIYKKKMKDTPETVKSKYETHVWIQEKLGVTEPELIEKAKKLDQARKLQDDQMNQVQELLEVERKKAIRLAQGKQIAKEEQSEFLPEPTTRSGRSEQYAANRIDPREATERQMLEVGAPKTEAEWRANIERIRSGQKPTDILSKDKKGKYTKKQSKKK